MTFARQRQEWLERKEAERQAQRQALCFPTVKPLHTGSYEGAVSGQSVPKKQRAPGGNAEQEHKSRLATLGCMACRRIHGPHEPGPVELHHLRKDGWGKGDYLTLIPLCVDHHRGPSGVHGLGTKGFAKHYGFDQQDLLDDALAMLEYEEQEE